MKSPKRTSNFQNRPHDIANSKSKKFRSHVYIVIIDPHFILLTGQIELFYMEDNPALQNIDIMTEAGESVVSTAFTRYTAAPTATSRSSKQVSMLYSKPS